MSELLQFMRRLGHAMARASARQDTLDGLDDDTLRDIGVRRSEIQSIEAEARRSAGQRTRRRVVTASCVGEA